MAESEPSSQKRRHTTDPRTMFPKYWLSRFWLSWQDDRYEKKDEEHYNPVYGYYQKSSFFSPSARKSTQRDGTRTQADTNAPLAHPSTWRLFLISPTKDVRLPTSQPNGGKPARQETASKPKRKHITNSIAGDVRNLRVFSFKSAFKPPEPF